MQINANIENISTKIPLLYERLPENYLKSKWEKRISKEKQDVIAPLEDARYKSIQYSPV